MQRVYILLAISVLLSSYAFAEVNYDYCSKFVKDTNAQVLKTGFAFPFVVDKENGDLTTTDYSMTYSKKKGGIHSYISPKGFEKREILVEGRRSNKIHRIKIKRDVGHGSFVQKINTRIIFDVKNGKCFPKRGLNSISLNGNILSSTIFDIQLCRDIRKYFDNNKDLTKCLAPENAAINKIFSDNDFDTKKIANSFGQFTSSDMRYAFSVEQKIYTGSIESLKNNSNKKAEDNKNMLGTLGGSPVMSAYMILSDCNERGLGPLIADKSVWQSKPRRENGNAESGDK